MSKVIEAKKFNFLLKELQNLEALKDGEFSLFLLGGGHQTKRFYKNLKKDPDVDVIWYGWSGPKWSKIFSFIPGQAGLVRLKNLSRLEEFYNRIGEQSTCSLYYIRTNQNAVLIDSIKKSYWNSFGRYTTESLVIDLEDYFIITTYFDHSEDNSNKNLYRVDAKSGSETNQNIKKILVKFTDSL